MRNNNCLGPRVVEKRRPCARDIPFSLEVAIEEALELVASNEVANDAQDEAKPCPESARAFVEVRFAIFELRLHLRCRESRALRRRILRHSGRVESFFLKKKLVGL